MDALHIVAPIVGGVAVETLHWYELRERLSEPKYALLFRSLTYWVPTVAMVAMGGAVAWIWAASKR